MNRYSQKQQMSNTTSPSEPIDWEKRKDKDLMFTGRALVACSLPLRVETITVLEKRGATQRFSSKYVRENGPFKVKIICDEEYGIPYGKDRLFLYWLITQAVRNKSSIVYYKSVRELLEALGLSYGKHNREWLKSSIDRIINSTIFLEYKNGHVHGLEKDTILKRVVGVLDPKRSKSDPYSECYFELSSDFYRELVKESHAIPFDYAVIKKLGDNYGAMDLYVWWNHRVWSLKASRDPYFYVHISALKDQFTSSKEMKLKKFKQMLKTRISEVNRAVQDVYGIDPKIQLTREKLSFKIISPPISSSENSNKPIIVSREKKAVESLPEPTVNAHNIIDIIARLKGNKKLSTE